MEHQQRSTSRNWKLPHKIHSMKKQILVKAAKFMIKIEEELSKAQQSWGKSKPKT